MAASIFYAYIFGNKFINCEIQLVFDKQTQWLNYNNPEAEFEIKRIITSLKMTVFHSFDYL